MSRSAFYLVAASWLTCCGCSTPPPDTQRFVPSPETGRQAVEGALRLWQQGQSAPAELNGVKVYLADNHHAPKQKLRRFAILGETPGDYPRCYAVRLWLEEPEEVVRVRYVVFGIDPLWVYRHEDFVMMLNWGCAGEDPATTKVTAPQITHALDKKPPTSTDRKGR
jgi:hypothetical protein